MQKLLGGAIGVFVCGLMLLSPARPATAGLFDWCCCCKKKECCHCPDCEKKEKKDECGCCFFKLPPRAEVAFAIPGVVRDEPAVRTEFSVQRMEMEARPKPAAEAAETTETACKDPSVNERLDALEGDVQKLAELMSRLTNVIDKQNEKQKTQP